MIWILGPAVVLGLLFYWLMMNVYGTALQKRWCDADDRSVGTYDKICRRIDEHRWYSCSGLVTFAGIVWPLSLGLTAAVFTIWLIAQVLLFGERGLGMIVRPVGRGAVRGIALLGDAGTKIGSGL